MEHQRAPDIISIQSDDDDGGGVEDFVAVDGESIEASESCEQLPKNPGPGPDLSSPLVTLFPELRAHMAGFLDAPELARLARTCKVFEQQLMRAQTGPLYFPTHWRRHVDAVVRRQLSGYTNRQKIAQFRMNLSAFLVHKARIHVFDGLNGAQSKLKLSVNVVIAGANTTRTRFVLDIGHRFLFENGRLLEEPSASDIRIMRDRVRGAHAAQLTRTRLFRRTVTPEMRAERARLTTELAQAKATMRQDWNAVRNSDPRQTPSECLRYATQLAHSGQAVMTLEAQLASIEMQITMAMTSEADEEK